MKITQTQIKKMLRAAAAKVSAQSGTQDSYQELDDQLAPYCTLTSPNGARFTDAAVAEVLSYLMPNLDMPLESRAEDVFFVGVSRTMQARHVSHQAQVSKKQGMVDAIISNYDPVRKEVLDHCTPKTQQFLMDYFLNKNKTDLVIRMTQVSSDLGLLLHPEMIAFIADRSDENKYNDALELLRRGKKLFSTTYVREFFTTLHECLLTKSASQVDSEILKMNIDEYAAKADKGFCRKRHGSTETIKQLTMLEEISQPLTDKGQIYEFEVALITKLRDERQASFSKSAIKGNNFLLFKGQIPAPQELSHTDEVINNLGLAFRSKGNT